MGSHSSSWKSRPSSAKNVTNRSIYRLPSLKTTTSFSAATAKLAIELLWKDGVFSVSSKQPRMRLNLRRPILRQSTRLVCRRSALVSCWPRHETRWAFPVKWQASGLPGLLNAARLPIPDLQVLMMTSELLNLTLGDHNCSEATLHIRRTSSLSLACYPPTSGEQRMEDN